MEGMASNLAPQWKGSDAESVYVIFYVIMTQPSCPLWDILTWWRHQMETFSALLAICAGNSPVTGEFPAQRPVTRSFDAFFDLRLNKRFSKQSWGWWFETPLRPLWRHSNELTDLRSIVSRNDMYTHVFRPSLPKDQEHVSFIRLLLMAKNAPLMRLCLARTYKITIHLFKIMYMTKQHSRVKIFCSNGSFIPI